MNYKLIKIRYRLYENIFFYIEILLNNNIPRFVGWFDLGLVRKASRTQATKVPFVHTLDNSANLLAILMI